MAMEVKKIKMTHQYNICRFNNVCSLDKIPSAGDRLFPSTESIEALQEAVGNL